MAGIATAAMIGAGVGAGVGILGGIMGGRAAAKAADAAREAEMKAAKFAYSSTESSVNIMKAVNMEIAYNQSAEVLRAGAAQNEDVREAVTRAGSTVSAQSEGLTSGRSKGRQMIGLYVQGGKALLESKGKTTTAINQIVDAQDKASNDLNNKLLSAHQNMATILTTPGAGYQQNPMEVVSAGLSGAQSGASIGGSFGGAGGASSSKYIAPDSVGGGGSTGWN